MLRSLVYRNSKLFFKDKGMFFTSLITPLILLVLFVTFLGKVYTDALTGSVPTGVDLPDTLIEGFVGGWLFSSLLAVCCVTVAFCSNMLMVQDKITGARTDLMMTPIKDKTMALGYFIASELVTLIICMVALIVAFIYLAIKGWYLSASDVVCIVLDVLLLTLFGTSLSSVINVFLSSQGQISAVGTIVSAGYGFICGAYMPISQFSEGIRQFISFLPGTYGTALLHKHLMDGVFGQLEEEYMPAKAVKSIRESFDSDIIFFDHKVSEVDMYIIMAVVVTLLVGVYILLNKRKSK